MFTTYFHRADLFGAGHGGLPVDVDGVRHQGPEVHQSAVRLVPLGGAGLLIAIVSLGFFVGALILVECKKWKYDTKYFINPECTTTLYI